MAALNSQPTRVRMIGYAAFCGYVIAF